MRDTVFFKTEAGAQEITARQIRLHPRVRSLLVLIDGKHRAGELLDTLQTIGVTEDSFKELISHGLIAGAGTPAAAPEAVADAPDTEMPLAPAEAPTQAAPADEQEQRRALYAYFNLHIRETLGLRGFMLQLQVEKAESLADYAAIRDQFLAAARKSKGDMAAAAMQAELDRLLAPPV
ncbi:hypothetical protein [Niveibacterium sp.]|uniref:hypothetical protein n=1 Tax=Niveibacterium sp. TaxID=2017444 RepID=UPI0035B456BE